jgi:hypothetical protein
MRTFWTCEGGNQTAVEKIQEWGAGFVPFILYQIDEIKDGVWARLLV